MKSLLKMLVGAAVAFQLGSIADEWEVFSPALLGGPPASGQSSRLSEEAQRAAVQAVRELAALSLHVYATGADQRFTDRLPAGEEVVAELLADVAYLQHAGLTQTATLMGLNVEAVEARGPQSAQIDAREYWVVSVARARDGHPVEPRRSYVLDTRYQVRLQGQRWRVEHWELRPPRPPAAGEGQGG